MMNRHALCAVIEEAMGIELSDRIKYIRVMMDELQRLDSHLLFYSCCAQDLGGLTAFIYGMRDREQVLNVMEETTGGRLIQNYYRIGGCQDDIDANFAENVKKLCAYMKPMFKEYDDIFTGNVGSGGNINCTTAGYYKLIADIPGGSLKAIKLTWGLVGPATPGGWDAGAYTVMTYNMADDCWEITTDLVAGEFKFTTNGTWDINLGGTLDDLSEGGNNLSIAEDGKYTIKLYPSRAQSDKMYATITKK